MRTLKVQNVSNEFLINVNGNNKKTKLSSAYRTFYALATLGIKYIYIYIINFIIF